MTVHLKRILSSLLTDAEAKPDRPAAATLPHGLRIELVLTQGRTVLKLSREGVYPSDRELATVLEHFPYPIQAAGRRDRRETRHFLIASWPIQDRLPFPTSAAPEVHP